MLRRGGIAGRKSLSLAQALESTECGLKVVSSSALSWNMKSSGNRRRYPVALDLHEIVWTSRIQCRKLAVEQDALAARDEDRLREECPQPSTAADPAVSWVAVEKSTLMGSSSNGDWVP